MVCCISLSPNASFLSQAAAFTASYSDSGLFGIYTIAQADSAGEVTIRNPLQQPQLKHAMMPGASFH